MAEEEAEEMEMRIMAVQVQFWAGMGATAQLRAVVGAPEVREQHGAEMAEMEQLDWS